MEREAILESKIEVLEKKLADCERELKAQRIIRCVEKDDTIEKWKKAVNQGGLARKEM